MTQSSIINDSGGGENWAETIWTLFALLMVVVAYYPTLIGDYVPMDQWRAFRYSLEPGLPSDRWDACATTGLKHYFFTGRWLVWVGQCAEHAAVAQIRDFAPLRMIVLTVVLLSVIVFRNVLKNIFNSPPVAIILAVMIVLLPGYAFMYYQGLTGMPVLFALLFSLLSFPFTSRALTAEKKSKKFYFDLGLGAFLFIIACLFYPAFAFAVIPVAFIFSAFRPEPSFSKRVNLCAKLCIFYAILALTYYLIVKTGIAIANHFGVPTPNLKNYQVDIATDPNQLMGKLLLALKELLQMPLASFLKAPAQLSLAILFVPAGIMFVEGQRLGWGWKRSIIAAVIYLVSIPVIVVASVSPWLLSHFSGAPYRHMLPVHFLPILSFGILITFLTNKAINFYEEKSVFQAGSIFLVILLAICSINQINLSQRQVIDSTIEIIPIRSAFRKLAESGRLWNLKEIHFVRPRKGFHYDGHRIDREFAPASMAHPEHIFTMTRAVLREILSTDQLRKIILADCRFDLKCAHSSPPNILVVSQSKFGTPLPKLRNDHVIINYSHLNTKPIKLAKPTLNYEVSASSQHKNYSPKHILGATGQIIWHAKLNPKYPQWVKIKYSVPQNFSILNIKAQASLKQDLTSRAPKHFIFQASNDGEVWTDLIEIKDAGFSSKNIWRTFKFENDKKYTFYRIYILSNEGDPSLLTIQQVALN